MWHKLVLASVVLAGLSGLGRECAGNLMLGVSVNPAVAELGVSRTVSVYLTDTGYGTDQATLMSLNGLSYADVTLSFDPTIISPTGSWTPNSSFYFDPTGNNPSSSFTYIPGASSAELALSSLSPPDYLNPVAVRPGTTGLDTGRIDLATITFQSGFPGTTTIIPSVNALADGSVDQNPITFDPTNSDVIQTQDVQVVPEASTVVGIVTGLCGFLAIFAVRRLRGKPQPAVS